MKKRMSYLNTNFTTRKDETTEELVLSGYFIRFDEETEIWTDYFEKIDKGAIDLSDIDVRALFNHDTSLVLGRTTNGTLNLSKDDKGLRGEIKINKDDPMAIGVYARIKRGDISGCSFGFVPTDIETVNRDDGTVLDIVKKLELFEVSPCTFPAYPQTEISARQKDFSSRNINKLEKRKNKFKEKYKWQIQ